jgi:glycosyltransferase involved in cell wall biosynthesis
MGKEKLKKLKVVFFNRKIRAMGNYSVEIYFKSIQQHLNDEFIVINKEMPFESNGIFDRLGNMIFSLLNQGDVNHITGDVHYVALLLKKSKTILTVLDCGVLHRTFGVKHILLKYFWFDFPVLRSKIVTTISNASKYDLIKWTNCDTAKIKVIYVCTSPRFVKSEREFNIEKPRILQIGTAINKNIQRLIAALKGINCTLVIVGKIDEITKKLIAENQIDLELLDYRLSEDEIIQEYLKCDILSFISTIEGFGMPIIEANAIGRVCITGNVSSMPEVASNAAHLVDPFNIQEIHDGFLKLINNKQYRDSLIVNGYLNASRFNAASIAEQYSVVYNNIKITNITS